MVDSVAPSLILLLARSLGQPGLPSFLFPSLFSLPLVRLLRLGLPSCRFVQYKKHIYSIYMLFVAPLKESNTERAIENVRGIPNKTNWGEIVTLRARSAMVKEVKNALLLQSQLLRQGERERRL